eukprot:gene8210-10513_t
MSDESQDKIGIMVDKYKMEQVLRNLFVNAVKFTPSGGTVTVSIRVEGSLLQSHEADTDRTSSSSPRRMNSTLAVSPDVESLVPDHPTIISLPDDFLIEVTDTGVGIPEEARPRIFGQFVQLDPHRLQGGGGSGLGLWISKEIVQKHGGTLTFAPGPDHVGTTFSVRLPAVRTLEVLCYELETRAPSLAKTSSFLSDVRFDQRESSGREDH